MKTYIILLRGINVGGKNLVPMKELARVLSDAGYGQVRTYIQSGNVVLQASQEPLDIGDLVEQKFGFQPGLVVLEKPEFLAAIERIPFDSPVGKSVHLYFCEEDPRVDGEKLDRYRSASEELQVLGRVAYLHAPDGIGRSKLAAKLESVMGVAATGRNLNTILKLQQTYL